MSPRARSAPTAPVMSVAIQRFLTDVGATRPASTTSVYRALLRHFSTDTLTPQEFTLPMCRSALDAIENKRTAYTAASVLNTFFGYCRRQRWIDRPKRIRLRHEAAPPPIPPTDDEFRAIWLAARHHPDSGARLLVLLVSYGLSLDEVRSIKWSDVDPKAERIAVRTARGGYKRFVPLHPVLARLLSERERRGPRIFDLSEWGLRRHLNQVVTSAGLRHLTPSHFKFRLKLDWIEEFADTDHLPSRGRLPLDRQRKLNRPGRLIGALDPGVLQAAPEDAQTNP